MEHFRHTVVNRELYRKRQETIERVFADTKEKHGMRWSRYRGLKKNDASSDAYFHCLEPQKACELVLGFPRESMPSLRFNREYIQKTLIPITK